MGFVRDEAVLVCLFEADQVGQGRNVAVVLVQALHDDEAAGERAAFL